MNKINFLDEVAKLTPEHRANLRKLADFLMANAEEISVSFDMATYNEEDLYPDETECGTVGCAAGHGPLAGIEPKEDEHWDIYINRCFVGNSASDLVYSWCFAPSWENVDNTPYGAALRINLMLENPGAIEEMVWYGEDGTFPGTFFKIDESPEGWFRNVRVIAKPYIFQDEVRVWQDTLKTKSAIKTILNAGYIVTGKDN